MKYVRRLARREKVKTSKELGIKTNRLNPDEKIMLIRQLRRGNQIVQFSDEHIAVIRTYRLKKTLKECKKYQYKDAIPTIYLQIGGSANEND